MSSKPRPPKRRWSWHLSIRQKADLAQASFKAIITGLVQGVGYRYYAVGHARRLGISGYAKNLPTGEVEVFAEGERTVLEEFLKLLKTGPVASDVSGVAVDWLKPSGAHQTFTIEY